MWKNSQKHNSMGNVQGEKLQSGHKEDRLLVSEGGVGVLHWQRCGVGSLC